MTRRATREAEGVGGPAVYRAEAEERGVLKGRKDDGEGRRRMKRRRTMVEQVRRPIVGNHEMMEVIHFWLLVFYCFPRKVGM